MKYPAAIQKLIDHLSILPSVGPKTAERYAFHLLKQREENLSGLAEAINNLRRDTKTCKSCQTFSASDICPICADPARRNGSLVIVENTQDLAAIEATGQHEGRYFVLGGLINTIEDIGPDSLNFGQLVKTIQSGGIQEVIIALNFTLEGESTALYLNKLLKDRVKISRLAKGLPAGSDLEYADATTLASALKNRNEIK